MPANKVVSRALEINWLHESLCDGLRTTLQTAIKIGGLLAEQKQELGYGQWGAWIEEHLSFSQQTASKYMRCHERRADLESRLSESLTIEDVARLSAKPTEAEILILQLADAYWRVLTKRRSAADQQQMARAVCQYLFKKYPELGRP